MTRQREIERERERRYATMLFCVKFLIKMHRARGQRSENSRRLWLSEIPCWKGFPANFDAAGKFFPDFLAARNAIPAKVWALSGKENGCWKIGRAFGNATGFSPPRPPQPSRVVLKHFPIFISCLAIPAAIYRSAPGPRPESAPRSAF